jgi:hypothetical protein
MDDVEIVHRINDLAAEEHELERSAAGAGLSDDGLDRLHSIEVSLDQCWDLLRQRRARRDADQNPDSVQARPAEIVEHYQQ